jgi:hypothetical protein
MKKGDLWNYHMEIQDLGARKSILSMLLGPQIKAFYAEFGPCIEDIDRELAEIRAQHYILDEAGRVRRDAANNVMIKAGTTMPEIQKAFQDLLSQPIAFKLKLHPPTTIS